MASENPLCNLNLRQPTVIVVTIFPLYLLLSHALTHLHVQVSHLTTLDELALWACRHNKILPLASTVLLQFATKISINEGWIHDDRTVNAFPRGEASAFAYSSLHRKTRSTFFVASDPLTIIIKMDFTINFPTEPKPSPKWGNGMLRVTLLILPSQTNQWRMIRGSSTRH